MTGPGRTRRLREVVSHRGEIRLAGRCPRDGVDDRDRRWESRSVPTAFAETPPARRRWWPPRAARPSRRVSRRGGRPARPTTAAPRTAGWPSSAVRTSSGITLNPPRMIAWSARPRIHRKPSRVDAGQVGGADPVGLPDPSWPGLTSSSPGSSGPSGLPPSSTTRSRAPRLARPTLPRLRAQCRRVVRQRPAGHSAAEFGCGIGGQHRYAELLGERVGVVGRQRRGARRDGDGCSPDRRGSGRSAAPCAARRAPATPPWAGGCAPRRPTVESSKRRQQDERSRLGDALQHPEHAADVHQRGVDDRDAAPRFGGGADSAPVPCTLRASMS